MGASMLLMAAGMRLPALAHLGPYVAVLGTLAYILSFSLGVGPVPALLVPEITPVNLRGVCVGGRVKGRVLGADFPRVPSDALAGQRGLNPTCPPEDCRGKAVLRMSRDHSPRCQQDPSTRPDSLTLKGKAMAMAMGTHWICNFAIGQAFLLAVNAFSVPVLYTFFGVVCLIGAQFARGIKSSTQLPEELPGTS